MDKIRDCLGHQQSNSVVFTVQLVKIVAHLF